MKFKSKVIEIEAWRWDCGEPMPEWLVWAEKSYMVQFKNKERSSGTTWPRNSRHDFTANYWLIYNGPDDIYPCDDGTFKQKYEAIDA